MRALRVFLLALCTALLSATFIPGARASDYPNSRAAGLVAAAYPGIPTTPNDAAPNAANTPDEPANVDQSQATQPQAAPSTDQSQVSQPQATPSTSPDESNKELPKTASPTPLIGLIGMLSLAAALGLRQFAKRMS